MRTQKRLCSLFLAIALIATALLSTSVAYSASAASISYNFSGANSETAGYAQGEITLNADSGTYWLYWADDIKALDGYSEIATLTVSSGSASHTMYAQTAIPADATKLIAVCSSSEPTSKTVAGAAAVYDIPEQKQFAFTSADKKYCFGSYSDIHIDANYSTYLYADQHWANALQTASDRDVDFIIESGDYTNNNVDISGIQSQEWKIYQKILAQSDYCNPIYEAIGNHELWQGVESGTSSFINATGLEGSNNTSDKAYYEKDINGDHFIFMALEGGFYPDRVEEFSDEQLDWLEALLKSYSGDGHNIYIIEHSLFYKYGAGDTVTGTPYYDIPLSDDQESTVRFKSLLEQYKDTIFISGHTHIAFSEQYNYSDNDGTSAQMIHNSSVGGTRHIINGSLDYTYYEDQTEGYIVDVYDGGIIFNGANLYYNEYDPNCCYIVRTSQQAYESMNPTSQTSESTTDSESTQATSQSESESESESQPESETPSQDVSSESTSESEGTASSSEATEDTTSPQVQYTLGDINEDGKISISDATCIQKYILNMLSLSEAQLLAADVNGDEKVDISDVTAVQKYLANLIDSLGSTKSSGLYSSGAEYESTGEILDLYYRYSSYDCYQALKKAYLGGADDSTLESLQQELLAVVDPENVDSDTTQYTLYFENNKSWSSVYAYCWGDSHEKSWPGTACTYVGKNSYGYSIYSYTVDTEKYDRIIFNSGSGSQTVDIAVTDNNLCYYVSSSSSPYSVSSYTFKSSYIVS